MTDTDRHLQLLSIFHYIAAGLTALFGCFPLMHVAIGILMLTGAFDTDSEEMPAGLIAALFIALPALFSLGLWIIALLTLLAGRKLAKKRSHTFCLVVAGVECLCMPIGTVLGVFTIITLTKPGVKEVFDRGAAVPDEPHG
jgi:branched-subunit amino acid ABC-type transport system permease component